MRAFSLGSRFKVIYKTRFIVRVSWDAPGSFGHGPLPWLKNKVSTYTGCLLIDHERTRHLTVRDDYGT